MKTRAPIAHHLAGRIAALAVALAPPLLAPASADAQATTHMGRPPSDQVALVARFHSHGPRGDRACANTLFENMALFRSRPDGTYESTPFQVPPGRLLIVTDVEWMSHSLGDNLEPLHHKATVDLTLHLVPPDETIVYEGAVAFRSRSVEVVGPNTAAGSSEQLTTGFLVEPYTLICPIGRQQTSNVWSQAKVAELLLRGYLVDAE